MYYNKYNTTRKTQLKQKTIVKKHAIYKRTERNNGLSLLNQLTGVFKNW